MQTMTRSEGFHQFGRGQRVEMPEINTYKRQITFCEKKVDKISMKFHVPNSSQNPTNLQGAQITSPECLKNGPSLKNNIICTRSSTNRSSFSRSSPMRRKSNGSMVHTPLLPSRKRSLISHLPERESTNYFNNNRWAFMSEGHGEAAGALKRNETDSTDNGIDKIRNERELNYENADSPVSYLEGLNNTLRKEQDCFIRALTTLAINTITSNEDDLNNTHKRNSTLSNYERNVHLLTNQSRQNLTSELKSNIDSSFPLRLASANKTIDHYSDSESSGSEIYAANGICRNGTSHNADKRQRVNNLKCYLINSGLGDPKVITQINKHSEEEKQAFNRLLRRVNRVMSREMLDRIRRKARLDYELCLMKGESFCEQQEQVYMRTASADMENNRDLQFLEEDLRIQALRDMRQGDQREQNEKGNSSSRITGQPNFLYRERFRGQYFTNQKQLKTKDETIQGGGNKMGSVDTTSTNNDRDALSGLIPHPMGRREMRKRILLWVQDVEEATTGQQKKQ